MAVEEGYLQAVQIEGVEQLVPPVVAHMNERRELGMDGKLMNGG